MDTRKAARVLFFIRNPGLGKVKTRLARELGEAEALALYEACVLDMLDTLDASGLEATVYCQPADELDEARAWLGGGRTVLRQRGGSLGERMRLALAESFERGADAAMVLGSDIPQLAPDTLRRAAKHLAEGPAVIGPATDGGYYLIGFSRRGFCPEVFHGIPWGGPDVLALTLDALRRKAITPALLPTLRDLDRHADVLALAGPPRPGEAEAKRTRAVLEKILGERGNRGRNLLQREDAS
jgi:hypothetical protein